MSSTVMSSSLPTRMSMAPAGFHQAKTVGAAYFMTNEPTGNYLVPRPLDLTGNWHYMKRSTRGVGAHGLPAPPGLDPLFSQGSIGVSPSKRFVANVNAGSNTVSVFSIDPSIPDDFDDWQTSIKWWRVSDSLAINKAGTRVCVVMPENCYKFDLWEGLIPLKNHSISRPQPDYPCYWPSQHAQSNYIQPRREAAYRLCESWFPCVWDINADGSLSTNFRTVGGGVLPFSLNHIPGKNALVVGPGRGLRYFTSTPMPGRQECPFLFLTGANCWSVYSKQSGNFYIIDVGTSTSLSVAPAGPIDSDVATIGKNEWSNISVEDIVLMSSCSSFIYSLAANVTGLAVLTVNGPGKAEIYQRLDVAGPAAAAKLPINRTNIQGMATFIGF
ncbi:hypothetical protein B0H13DRAFT_2483896 [Mycena leptocephala]|nr:hypothetical protein B0H13DRAFT_2483896 [Mycena leptocephala]